MKIPFAEDVGIGDFSIGHGDAEFFRDIGICGGIGENELDILYMSATMSGHLSTEPLPPAVVLGVSKFPRRGAQYGI